MSFRILIAVAVTVGFPFLVLSWLWVAELLERLAPRRYRVRLRAALWLLPGAALVGTFLIWPLVNTIWLTIGGSDDRPGLDLDNLGWLADSDQVREALRNNVLWVVVMVCGCLLLGLTFAVLADKVRYESTALAVVLIPTAISFVCGAVMWGFMYDYQPPGLAQVGTLNGTWVGLTGGEPVAWLVDRRTNNAALIVIGLWSALGFATVIISSALKVVSEDILDAGRVDGATGGQVLRYLVMPTITPTLVVVATLVGIMALKAFDIVYVLTGGNYGTNVIANVLYNQLFIARDAGHASAVALLLTGIAMPLFFLNAWAARRQASS